MPHTALNDPVRIFARELPGVGTRIWVWCTVGIPFERDGGNRDGRGLGKPLFQLIVLRFAFGQAEPPAVVMDHNADMIRIVEGRRATLKRRIVEAPLRRSELPDELRKLDRKSTRLNSSH